MKNGRKCIKNHCQSYTECCLILLALLCFSNTAYAEIRIDPRLSYGVDYSDNISLNSAEDDYDFVTLLAAGAGVSLIGSKSSILIDYQPIWAVYTRFPERDSLRQTANLGGVFDFARSARFDFANSFLQTEDPVSDVDTTVRRGRSSYFSNTATVGMAIRYGAENEIRTQYVFYVLENDDIDLENSSYQEPSLRWVYWNLPSRYGIEINASYTVSEFDISEDFESLDATFRITRRFSRRFEGYIEYRHDTTDFLQGEGDYRINNLMAGISWAEWRDTQLSASFGGFYRDNQAGEDNDGITGTIDMAYTWDTGRSISLNGQVGFDQSYFGAENLGFSIFSAVNLGIQHPLGRMMAGSITAGYRHSSFIDQDADRQDDHFRGEAALSYMASTWLSINLSYRYAKLRSSLSENDYDENRATVSLSLIPRRPIRL